MTLFEYIFGQGIQKTDAERYMEERNREYAKKAAMYKRREQYGKKVKTLLDYLVPMSSVDTYTEPITMNKVTQVRPASEIYEMSKLSQEYKQPTTESINATKQRLMEKYNIDSCLECDESDEEERDASVFEITTVVLDPKSKIYKVCGSIKRGRFSMNDIVCVKNGILKSNAGIKRIIRRGEVIQYANV